MSDKYNEGNRIEDIEDMTGGGRSSASRSSSGRRNRRSTRVSRSGRSSRSSRRAAGHSSARHGVNVAYGMKNAGGNVSRTALVIRTAGLLVLSLIMAAGIYVGVTFLSAPDVNTDDIYSMLSQRSIMYDADGNEIDNLYFSDGNRTVVEYDDIPEDMVNAVVSIEDRKFWKHNGFNFVRMLGAIKDSVFGGGGISGTSTVTQQLARNVYLSEIKSQRSMSRKISEAYCTIVLEKNLTKEEIMEAYLNTIYLGFNSYGVQSASQAYFSKDVKELDTLECASLAALPQSPDTYALVKADYENSDTSLPAISSTESVTYLYNGDMSKDRRDLVIRNMEDSGYITASEMDEYLSDDLQKHMKIGNASSQGLSSYFADYTVEQLTNDIISEYGVDRAYAQNMIYTGGLKIYTTMDSGIQSIVEDEFDKDSNYAGIAYTRTNASGDLLDKSGEILLYSYSNYFNDKDEFVLQPDEFSMDSEGNMKILSGKRLNIYKTVVNEKDDISIEFKGMHLRKDGTLYFIESGALSIPQGYKTADSEGNAVISAQFFKDYPEFFVKDGDSYKVTSSNYSLKQQIKQPQASTVIMENKTGEIKAMMGGRGATGKQLYNRSTNPRQPGSSIKPIAVYGPALQMSYEYQKDGKTMSLDTSEGSNWGRYITAGSIINDAPITFNGRTWPKNAYPGYKGQMTLRRAVQQSVNVCAVKTFQQIGPDYSSSMLRKVGITTVDDEGEVNDMNPAALALGGMTNGISTLELTAAYATFPSGGEYKSPVSYKKVLNSKDEVLFEKSSEKKQVYNEGVAWIMTDILRSVVTEGIATGASIGSQPVGGKTGTTDNNFDALFSGFTPQYTCALWMGNDVGIALTQGSAQSARFWSNIMSRVCEGLPRGSFRDKPANVVYTGGEYYIDGTYSSVGITNKGSGTTDETTEATEATETTETIPSITENSTESTESQPSTEPPTEDPVE